MLKVLVLVFLPLMVWAQSPLDSVFSEEVKTLALSHQESQLLTSLNQIAQKIDRLAAQNKAHQMRDGICLKALMVLAQDPWLASSVKVAAIQTIQKWVLALDYVFSSGSLFANNKIYDHSALTHYIKELHLDLSLQVKAMTELTTRQAYQRAMDSMLHFIENTNFCAAFFEPANEFSGDLSN